MLRFFRVQLSFLAFLKVLFLATFISDTGVNIPLFVKVGDLFSLSKAKKQLFSSECVLFCFFFIHDF